MNLDIIFLEEAQDFLDQLDLKARKKVFSDTRKTLAGLRGEWFRKMPGTDGIWEFRTLFNKSYYRLFAFWDTRDNQKTLIVSTNGLIKKTDKTPLGEIERAERIKRDYFNAG